MANRSPTCCAFKTATAAFGVLTTLPANESMRSPGWTPAFSAGEAGYTNRTNRPSSASRNGSTPRNGCSNGGNSPTSSNSNGSRCLSARHDELQPISGIARTDGVPKLNQCFDRFSVGLDDPVSRFQAGFRRRRLARHAAMTGGSTYKFVPLKLTPARPPR